MQRADRLPEAHLPHQGSFAGGAWDKAEELRTSRACSQGKHPPLQLQGGRQFFAGQHYKHFLELFT